MRATRFSRKPLGMSPQMPLQNPLRAHLCGLMDRSDLSGPDLPATLGSLLKLLYLFGSLMTPCTTYSQATMPPTLWNH